MTNISDAIKNAALKAGFTLSISEVGAVKRRLGISFGPKVTLDKNFASNVVAAVTSMRKTKEAIVAYSRQLMAAPKAVSADQITADSSVLVSLINGRVVHFDPRTFVVMPLREQAAE